MERAGEDFEFEPDKAGRPSYPRETMAIPVLETMN